MLHKGKEGCSSTILRGCDPHGTDAGLNVDKNAVQRIEAGKRFVTDIELVYLSEVLAVPLDDLLDREKSGHSLFYILRIFLISVGFLSNTSWQT